MVRRIPNTRNRIMDFIRRFSVERGYAPTVRDIVRGCGISTTSVVQHHLNKLEQDGRIQRDPQVFRSIRLLETGPAEDEAPLLGVIAAGEPVPVPAADTWTTVPVDTVRLPAELVGRKKVYALKVRGTSMIDALIDDGDIVFMQPVNTVRDGDMVAVWLKDRQEVTLKKIYREPLRIRLQPANRDMSPIYVEPETVEVQGKVVGVIRRVI